MLLCTLICEGKVNFLVLVYICYRKRGWSQNSLECWGGESARGEIQVIAHPNISVPLDGNSSGGEILLAFVRFKVSKFWARPDWLESWRSGVAEHRGGGASVSGHIIRWSTCKCSSVMTQMDTNGHFLKRTKLWMPPIISFEAALVGLSL